MYYVINIIYVVRLFCAWDMWINEIVNWKKNENSLLFLTADEDNSKKQLDLSTLQNYSIA